MPIQCCQIGVGHESQEVDALLQTQLCGDLAHMRQIALVSTRQHQVRHKMVFCFEMLQCQQQVDVVLVWPELRRIEKKARARVLL